ncbi:MAG: response regulator transcription factor [Candidatus Galacturonibacter soehngenii]|nr:response regulator transcription factor [Candidatus Galacturonibacter soehngenii]
MLNIAICDDNGNDLTNIKDITNKYLKTKNICYQIIIFKSGEELLRFDNKLDLIFLDIAMDGINGIQAGKEMRKRDRNVKIIYTTSYGQYCEQAVNNVHAFAYLEKPITKNKAEQQLDEVMQYLQEENKKTEMVKFEVIEITKEGKIENKIKNFKVNDIFYFEYLNRKVKIKLENEEYFSINKMKDLVNKMSVYNFEICHQCFMVNLRHVKRIKGYEVFLENNEKIPVSQKKSADFRKKLNKFIQSNI